MNLKFVYLSKNMPVIPAEKNQDDEPICNKESKVETSTPKIKEKVIDKTGQDQINKLDKPDVISEPTVQPNLTQNKTNKESVNQEQKKPDSHGKPVTTHTNIRMCTVRLEILTEADIMKHVHVHKETESKMAPPAKPSKLVGTVETVETVEMVHFTRSRTKTKSPKTNRLPRSASSNIAYVQQDEQSDSASSPRLKENETQDQKGNRVAHVSKQICSVLKVLVSDPCADPTKLQAHIATQQTKCPLPQGLVKQHHLQYRQLPHQMLKTFQKVPLPHKVST